MKCLKCGCSLSEKDFCTNCGADVRIYKKIIRFSNTLYNDGLAKANVRDLSGAVVSLRQSLRFHKNNIQARNLLGLVYYEMGETVSALGEWVISKNLCSDKNIANDYIKAIQLNPNRLETINQTIKKYNQALLYCKQGSEDLAIIQLKKVLSLNPNLIQGHQLIALLYMRAGELEKASKALKKAAKIDTTNTTTMRYLMELDKLGAGRAEEESKDKNKLKSRDERKVYKSGNDLIIQPPAFKENSGLWTVINILVGVVIGAAALGFLFMPASLKGKNAEKQELITEYTSQLSTKEATISDLESQLETANQELETTKADLEQYEGDSGLISGYENLISAMEAYNENDVVTAAEKLAAINVDSLSEEGKVLYQNLQPTVIAAAADSLYTTGYASYNQGDYDTAINDLAKVIQYDETNVRAYYYLAKSYKLNGNIEKANEYYQMVIDKFPDTQFANYAQSNIS